ncbi:putative peroxidase [Bombardia bombarda]|uniref:Peroxidase n=1 Tax=Bombardia bombarda TaxID=252184 RepID=A0AA39TGA5_9PEZI|nr:putative peroxidase [Bombardia bombarda]
MKLFSIVKLGLMALGTASCFPEPAGHEWHVAGPDDKRSPCPGLNAMANHGYLPRSGKFIDKLAIRSGVSNAYNYPATLFDGVVDQVLAAGISTTGDNSTFNLDDLASPGAYPEIQFDGSLSRNDKVFGDALNFDLNIWGHTAERLDLYTNSTGDYVTIEVAAAARAARVQDAMSANPGFTAGPNFSLGTTALYLTTMWDTAADAAPKSWVRAFFENERIPFTEGYFVPETQKDLGAMFARVVAASPA